jgi:hypothetical protein
VKGDTNGGGAPSSHFVSGQGMEMLGTEGLSAASAAVINDVWLSLQNYHKAVLEADGALLIYNAFATQQQKQAHIAASRVTSLLQATVKVFVHEQSRLYEDATDMLRATLMNTAPTDNRVDDEGDDDAGSCNTSTISDGESPLSSPGRDPSGLLSAGSWKEGGEDTAAEAPAQNEAPSMWKTLPFPALAANKCIAKYAAVRYCLSERLQARAHKGGHQPMSQQLFTPTASSSSSSASSSTTPILVLEPPFACEERTATVEEVIGFGTPPPKRRSAAAADDSPFTTAFMAKRGESYLWRQGVVVVTFDSVMHVFDGETVIDETHQFVHGEPLLSMSVRGAIVEPVLIPVEGETGDAFKVYIGANRSQTTQYDKKQTRRSISLAASKYSIAILVPDASIAREWMRVISSPSADPHVDPPEDRTKEMGQFHQQQSQLNREAATGSPSPSQRGAEA